MNDDKKHYLVVGAGLAGYCVSIQLLRRNTKVTLVDSGENFSSAIAAGLINPLVFRRMTKSWRLDECMSYLQQFYSNLESESGQKFFHPVLIRRIFAHKQERDFWIKRQHTSEFEDYMEALTSEDDHFSIKSNVCGTGRVKKAAFVDVDIFLTTCKNYVSSHGNIINHPLNYDDLEGLVYQGKRYDGVIFCEGFQAKKNPWYNYLPLGQTKGETLTIRSAHIPEDISLNLKCFVLPKGDSVFKVGATYSWHNPTTHCTNEGREELKEKIAFLTDRPYEILEQSAGVRPTSIDRRPFLGEHPTMKNYFIFNGLGTKGYMIAPLLSAEFTEFLLEGKSLDPDMNIARFSE